MKTYDQAALSRVLTRYLEAPAESDRQALEHNTSLLLARLSELGRRALEDDGGEDRSRHVARVIERLHFEGFGEDEAIAVIRERGGSWKERYKNDAALTKDLRRIWSKYAVPKEEEQRANAVSTEAFLNGQRPPVSEPLIKATPFQPMDAALIPRRQTLYAGHFNRQFFSATFGIGGGGKSSLVLVEAVALATGLPLLGHEPSKPLKVWYFNLEDPPEELQRRVTAIAIHYGVNTELLAKNLFVDSGRLQELVLLRQQGRDSIVAEALIQALISELEKRSIDVFILDPLVSAHQVDENDNSKIQQFANQLARIANDGNVAVEGVHHVNKSAGDGKNEVTADSGRGAGALKDKARSVRAINTMSEKEAEKAGIDNNDRFSYFRVTSAKSNMGRRSGRSDWYRIVSVDLGNGTKWTPGDSVGVVERWQWPSDTFSIDEITPEHLAEIKRRIGQSPHGENAQFKDWAGRVFGEVLGLNAEKDKRKIARTMKALTSQGHFAIVHRRADNGRARPMFEVASDPHHQVGGVVGGVS
ncbi:AAA family ATPase [Bradyrhizobium sp. RD5-C2]|uniref:AAA family ATPase n=1 Tax=Bradyrhizobium sp. RD5-C2 TaxID=244562 RepID=UPI001CC43FC9|nr:AAA family ATPase [Bradyrhizobium sp. RD5-C2]GIQ76205.1 hypothetical protein BraRD5C2_46490 [Bradyrhizobium sp. RD5-C2]